MTPKTQILLFQPDLNVLSLHLMKGKISHTEIFKLAIPMEPFVIATEVSTIAQNTFIRIHTEDGLTGMGECSAFPMLVGETQATCFEVARDLARIIKGKSALEIERNTHLPGF
jgi:L-Ala-D/L-Glu epimerase